MERLKKLLDSKSGARILDTATGRGSFIDLIMKLDDNYSEIIGIDISEKAIEMAKNSIKDSKVSFKLMDINNMTFKKHSFDIVCLSNSLHHMSDMNNCIDNMLDMVKPKGILLFNEMISDNEEEAQNTHTYMHHFWAEIDRVNNVVHNETMKKQKLLDVFTGHQRIKIESVWELEFAEEQEINEEAYVWLNNTLDNSLDRVKGHKDYKKFKVQAEQLKTRLSKIGFKPATQVIIVAKTFN